MESAEVQIANYCNTFLVYFPEYNAHHVDKVIAAMFRERTSICLRCIANTCEEASTKQVSAFLRSDTDVGHIRVLVLLHL